MACNYLVLGLVIHTNSRGVWITFYFSLPVDPVDFIVLGKICAARRCKVNIEINAIFVKCLFGTTFNDHLKVEPRVVSKGNIGDVMERDLWLSLSLYRQVI